MNTVACPQGCQRLQYAYPRERRRKKAQQSVCFASATA